MNSLYIMKKQLKTAQQRAKDRKVLRDLTKRLHAEAFELVCEFESQWEVHGNITEITSGLVSRMLHLNTYELTHAKMRVKQEFTGEKFADDTTWNGFYQKEETK
tara:strand:+ start:716 stop:1027 length:312 start_codon:yes stop_codon:yes gene_type:complete